ncbi:Plant organelle RNA recognition domain [Dillenia turbinata]|uniref:Plant organelle RNA recognition domain n=1 Tax=Dillenia turbinata TaxID=194707 RepID=A0AAN8ZI05_9MAGN
MLRPFSKNLRPRHHLQHRQTIFSSTEINPVRDRGLDHAVEKENNLKPLIAIKNFIKSEPAKSVPLPIIADNKLSLGIPFRAIDFIRRYPSVFIEFLPGNVGIHPHIRLTDEVLSLDAEEQLIYQSDSYRQQAADRVLKLLMLAQMNKIPLNVLEKLKWDLGLPDNYVEVLIPEFPDYFRVIGMDNSKSSLSYNGILELVCWSNELAISEIEKNAMKGEVGYSKGKPVSFPMQFSRGFEMDAKLKKWVNEWQKLPYISPYENASHLPPKSDEAEKWVVGVMHELLNLLVPKKTEKENLLCLAEYLGLRSRFKRALLNHPGIFYISSKIRTHTVVLREGYKRDLLIEKHPFMNLRYRYIHLMNTVKEDHKPISVPGGSAKKDKTSPDSNGRVENQETRQEKELDMDGVSTSEVEDTDEDYDDDDDYISEEEHDDAVNKSGMRVDRNDTLNRLRTRKTDFERRGSSGPAQQNRFTGRNHSKTQDKVLRKRTSDSQRAVDGSQRPKIVSNSLRRKGSLPNRRENIQRGDDGTEENPYVSRLHVTKLKLMR